MRAYRKIDEPYEIKIEPGKLILLGVGAGLTLLLVFLVGVLVGKSLWGAKAQPAAPSPELAVSAPQASTETSRTDAVLVGLSTSAGDPGMTPVVPGGGEPSGETAVGPSTVASVPRLGAGEGMPQAGVATPGPAGEPPPKPAPDSRASALKAPEAAKASPPASPAPAAKPAVLPPQGKPEAPLPSPQFTVQVGSFRDRTSADDQAKKIGGQGVAAQVVVVSVEGRNWYRVQVGRFQTRAEAEAHYQKKMRPRGVQGFVTTR